MSSRGKPLSRNRFPRRQLRWLAINAYAVTHRKTVAAFEGVSNDAKRTAWACRRRLTPYRTYLRSDHLGFHYEPGILQWNWLGRTIWADWAERESQQRKLGRAGILCLAETEKESPYLPGAPELCALAVGHDGPHVGLSEETTDE